MSQKIAENKQVIVQDNPKWREELEALFRYEALNYGKEKTELDKSRKIRKSTRSKDSKTTQEGNE